MSDIEQEPTWVYTGDTLFEAICCEVGFIVIMSLLATLLIELALYILNVTTQDAMRFLLGV